MPGSVVTYLSDHNLEAALTDAMNSVLKTRPRPENPLQSIALELRRIERERSGASGKCTATVRRRMSKTPKIDEANPAEQAALQALIDGAPNGAAPKKPTGVQLTIHAITLTAAAISNSYCVAPLTARVELPFLGARTKKASEPLEKVPVDGEEARCMRHCMTRRLQPVRNVLEAHALLWQAATSLEYRVEMAEAVEDMFEEAYTAESQQEELGGGTELDV
jgi:hypothetical protein